MESNNWFSPIQYFVLKPQDEGKIMRIGVLFLRNVPLVVQGNVASALQNSDRRKASDCHAVFVHNLY